MNKKGFTLIELLAVIVILAIIALIATPIVLNIISDVKKNSAEISMKNIDKAASLYFQTNNKEENIIFECNKGKCKYNNKELELNGKSPESGRILIDKKGNITYEDIVLNGFNCYKEHDKFVCDTKKTRKTYTESEIVINSNSEYNLFDYNIYGNSIQDETTQQYESVGDKTNNLLDISKMENGTIKSADGSNYELVNRTRTDYIFLEKGVYTLSTVAEQNDVEFGGYCHKYSSKDQTSWLGKIQLTNVSYADGKIKKSLILDEDCYCRFVLLPTTTSSIADLSITNIANYTPQIEIGNEATDYEQYGKYKIKIKISGKNKFDVNKITQKSTKTITYNGTDYDVYNIYNYSNPPTEYTTNSNFKFDIDLKKGKTYTVSLIFMGGTSNANGPAKSSYIYMPFLDEKGNSQTFLVNSNSNIYNAFGYWGATVEPLTRVKFTITPTENIIKGALCMYANGAYGYVLEDSIQIEENTTVTDYEPYNGEVYNIYLNEPLRNFQSKADYIDFKNEKVVRYIEEDNNGNLKVLSVPKEEKIELSEILIKKGVNNIEIETSIKPSKVELEYNK